MWVGLTTPFLLGSSEAAHSANSSPYPSQSLLSELRLLWEQGETLQGNATMFHVSLKHDTKLTKSIASQRKAQYHTETQKDEAHTESKWLG